MTQDNRPANGKRKAPTRRKSGKPEPTELVVPGGDDTLSLNGADKTGTVITHEEINQDSGQGIVGKNPAVVSAKGETLIEAGIKPPEAPDLVEMRPDAPLAEAGRGVLKQLFQKLRESEVVARAGEDPEGVHDMRVATRRLRAALKVLEGTVYEPKVTAKFRRSLRGLANSLTRVRDSDVFLAHLDEYIAGQPEETQEQLMVLRNEINKQREKARAAMLERLDRKKTRRMLEKLEKFITTPGAGVIEKDETDPEVAPSLVRHFCGSAIWRAYEEVLAYETALPAPVPTLHRLRVACKRLRYTINFFEDALPEDAKHLAKEVSFVQDYLGDLHDHRVGSALAENLLKKQPDNRGVEQYGQKRAEMAQKMSDDFMERWKTLTGSDFRRRLALVLVE